MSLIDTIKFLRISRGLEEDMTLAEACEEFNTNLRDAMERLEQAGVPAKSECDMMTSRQLEVFSSKFLSDLREMAERELPKITRLSEEREKKKQEYYAKHGLPVPIIGMNNGRVESKEKLRERLTEVAMHPTEFYYFDGAMCYSPIIPNKEAVIKHKCPTCGTIHKYKEKFYEYPSDRYAIEEERIGKYVDEIKALGYDVSVENMCFRCYKEKYGKDGIGLSLSVFHFMHVDEDTDIINVVDSDELYVLAEFLKGNNAYKGYHDETTWINKKRNVVERLLGIKIEEE